MSEAVLGRLHAERLLQDLKDIRTELVSTMKEFTPEQFHLAPRTGMKTCKQQLQEIGTMETLSLHLVTHGKSLGWNETWESLDKGDVETMLTALTAVRANTLDYLNSCTEEQIETPIPLPVEWQEYFNNAKVIEPEELLRWIGRHEYYHLGQLVTYSMLCAEKLEAA